MKWTGETNSNSVVDCGTDESHHNEHSTTKVQWGGHDTDIKPMDGYSISEVDWRAHDSSYFLYLVHIDPDAKSKNFSTKEMDELCERKMGTPSGTQEGSKSTGSPFEPTVGPYTKSGPPTSFNRPKPVSKSMPDSEHYNPVSSGENGERFNLHPSHGIYETFFLILKMIFPTPNQSSNIKVHTISIALIDMKVVTINLSNGTLGRNLYNLHSSGKQ